ncbi:LysR family transcriptional regulator [Phyllobacterium myrsinacearum]|uniref:DNA-binding transcriptional LysR family regulator n=1 Tax=Phyllobacterium myrsinacearum TaxID=28101 RepID=A0A839EVY5_9HYPH|nr:LysR family transcriptional regulator [Phyllobacterium myrsinacearum]MBA8881486.1 DNA-binding transcriptional LysR family regulator [Phyllobacterium myrsinacearum]
MDVEGLKTFLAVYRQRSFSNAARVLNRTQPAISNRIHLLEQELGMPVFERTTAGIMLSQAGRVLLPYAERVLASVQDADAAMQSLATENAGPVAIAIVGTLAGTRITQTLKRFVDAHPTVDLTLQTARSTEVSELVRRGEATIGLRYDRDRSSDLDYRILTHEKLLVACAPNHPLARQSISFFSELLNERWIAFPEIQGQREIWASHVFSIFSVLGHSDLNWMPVDSLTAQKRLVEAGFGLALMTESSIAEERASGAMRTIDVNDLTARMPIFSVTRKGGFLSAGASSLLGILFAEFAAGSLTANS